MHSTESAFHPRSISSERVDELFDTLDDGVASAIESVAHERQIIPPLEAVRAVNRRKLTTDAHDAAGTGQTCRVERLRCVAIHLEAIARQARNNRPDSSPDIVDDSLPQNRIHPLAQSR